MSSTSKERVRLFFREVRRRRLFGVSAVYVVVCGVIWQVADMAFPALGLPEWTFTLVVVLSFLGFPVALVLGWAYDLEPEGVVRTSGRSEFDAPGEETKRPNPVAWALVEDHLQRALDEEPTGRQRYLEGLDESEPGIRSEVESLLEAHDSDGLLDQIIERLNVERRGARREPGTNVAQYRLVRRLGGGGMGVVYEAVDGRIDRRVALKFLAPEISANHDAKARFLMEARAAATLDHPNVCTVLEVGEDEGGSLFIAMPYYDGESLRSRIQRGPLDLDEALDVARQVAEGLASAHRRGIVHRDIKPANVMLTADGVAKIVDFGVAKMADASLTRTGAALGSPSYMSPEQTRGEEVDHRTDLWSLGIVLFEMVTGRRPFLGPNEHAIRTAVLSSPAPPLLPDRPDATAALDELVARALHKEREERYGSAADLIADIGNVLEAGLPESSALIRPILPPGERRMCSILSIRLVHYEQLVEEVGQEQLRAVSRRIDTAITGAVSAEGGVLLGNEGDRCHAAFGIPMTHEDDGQRALCAALAVRDRVKEIGAELENELSIRLTSALGVDSGYVVVRRDSEGLGYDVSGRPLRVARELAQRAPLEAILLSSECRRLALDSIETGSTSELHVTGEEGLVTAHTLVSAATERSTLAARAENGLTAFRGRTEELSSLSRLAQDSLVEGGGVVQILGEPGVGKSRLVLEFAATLDPSRFRLLTGRALPVSRSTSYAPIAEILRLVVSRESDGDAELQADVVVDALLELGEELRGSIPLLLRLLSLSHAEYPFPKHLSGDLVRLAMMEAVAGLFSLLAEQLPLVLVFEDWHWADDASTSALRQLAAVAGSFPMLLVVTIRTGYGVDLRDLPRMNTISLDPLGPETSAGLLSSVLGAQTVDGSLARALGARTGGNPFYIEEFGADLLEQGVVTIDGGTARLVESKELRLPDSVQAVIRTRLDRLDPAAKGILFTAAVIGRDFGRTLVREIADEPEQLDRALETLKASGLVQQTRVLPDPAYRFKHALTLEVTYESLLAHQRRTLHLRAAESLESRASASDNFDVLAHHFANARAWARALPYGVEAARRSVELSEFEDAAAMLDTVTDEWAPRLDASPETDRLLLDGLLLKERVLDHTGQRKRQQATIDRIARVVERLGDPRGQMELTLRQGDLFATVRRYEEAERVLEGTLDRSRTADDPEMQRKALRSLAMVWWHQDSGREQEALALLKEALHLDLANEDIDGEVGDRANICTLLLSMGRLEQALEVAESLREMARPENAASVHLANYHLGRCHRALGDKELALEFLERATEVRGPGVDSSFVRSAIAGVQLELGKPEKALEEYSLIIEEARRHGLTGALALSLKSSAEVLSELGRGTEAIPLMEEAQRLFADLHDMAAEVEVSATLASLYRDAGRLQETVAVWGTVRQLARRQDDRPLELRALEGLAAATREHFGEDDLAVPLYEEASAIAGTLGDRPAEVRALNSLGVIAWDRGDLDAAKDFYERALEVSRSGGRPDDTVLLLASLAAVHRKSGRLDDAIGSVREAIDQSEREDTNPLLRGYALGILGDALLETKDLDGAERAYRDSLGVRRSLGDERGEGWMLVKLSDVEVERGALDRVRELNSRAYEIASRIDDQALIQASTGRERY